MASKQTKIASAKVAVSSPAQPSKLPVSTLAAPPASLTSTESQAPLPTQSPPEMFTMKDLQAAFSTMTEKLERKIEEQVKGLTDELETIKETIETHNIVIREDIVDAIKGGWDYTLRVEEKVEGVEQQFEGKLGEIKSDIQDQAVMVQYNQMMLAIRIRELKKIANENQEDLRRIFEEALAQFLEDGVQNVSWQIDRIYRVNSWIAKQRNLPRDIVIYCVTRRFRNYVLTTSYNKKLTVAGQEVVVLKEIPPKMLRARKDYAFLVAELKKRAIQFRWEAPAGLSLFYQGNRHRLISVGKAKDFFENVLKAGKPPSSTPKRADSPKERDMELKQQIQSSESQSLAASGVDKGVLMELPTRCIDIFQPLEVEKPKDQRQTRATTKRMEQQEKEQQVRIIQAVPIRPEAMGARPKKKMVEKVDLALQKLSQIGHVK